MTTDPQRGLTASQAAEALSNYGPNATPEAPRESFFARLLGHMKDVLIILLLIAAVVKAWMGDWIDFSVIFIVAIVNVAIGMIQEGKAEKALDSIKSMLAVEANVLRDGEWQRLAADELVPGDIVRVRSGDRIPADMRIVEATNLQADESVLTGESDAVVKTTDPVADDAAVGDRTNMLHSGTLVTTGTGLAQVTATGLRTEIGKIQDLMSDAEGTETPLARQLDVLGKRIAVIVAVMAVIMVFLGGVVYNFTGNELVSATIGFAVAAIPEGLPALVAITLALGVQQMARRNAITRKLTSVEALGSVSVICSDKTGTLTKNEMTARAVVTTSRTYNVTGEGYSPHGEIHHDDSAVEARHTPDLWRLVCAASAANDSDVRQEGDQWKLVGQPTDGGLRVLTMKAGAPQNFDRLAAVPFESSHKFAASLDAIADSDDIILHAVGAPDRLLARSAHQYNTDGQQTDLDQEFWDNKIDELAAQGLRVLSVAHRHHAGDTTDSISVEDVEDLTFLGLVGIVDPPRPEAIDAIKECQRAGIDVVMITGDHAGTATTIAREMGIVPADTANDATIMMTGAQLDGLDASGLEEAVRTVRVFARTSPEHKLRIVRALQHNGETVAMTGDGVNDAPALQRADVGVAMGIKGTEATKEAADIVLADDNFATIERAVEEGRRIFDNIRKSVVFLLPTNGAQSLVILFAVLVGAALPLTPAQILWINMITAVTLSLALAYEPAEPGLMDRKPRNPREGVLTKGALLHVGLVSLLIGGVTLAIVWFERSRGSSEEITQTTAVMILAFAQLAYLLNCRFLHRSSITLDVFRGNKVVWIASLSLITVQLLYTLLPFMNTWFGSTPLPLDHWLLTIGVAVVVFFIIESGKAVQRRVTALQ